MADHQAVEADARRLSGEQTTQPLPQITAARRAEECASDDDDGQQIPPPPSPPAAAAAEEEAKEEANQDVGATASHKCAAREPDLDMTAPADDAAVTQISAAPTAAAQSVCAPDLLAQPSPPLLELIVTPEATAAATSESSSDDAMTVSQSTQKWILTTFMMFNALITPGGIIYGWPGLSQMLKDSYEYTSDCGPDYTPESTCSSQDNKLNNIFAVGANVATLSTVVYGFTLDRFGVRVNAFSGSVIMAAGFLLLAFSSSHPGGMDAFIPGFSMVAFGGLGTYLPALQFANLFSRPTRILSIQSALYGVAGLTFTFFKFLAENEGISRKTSFTAYAILVMFCGINMALLYPAKAYRPGDTIHLPVLGWLGIQAAPKPRMESEGLVNGHSSTGGDPAKGLDYSPLPGEETPSTPSNATNGNGNGSNENSLGESSSPAVVIGVAGSGSGSGSGGEIVPPTKSDIDFLVAESLVRDLNPVEKQQVLNSRSLKDELLCAPTILLALHFSVGLLCSNMYNANINSILKKMGTHSTQITNAFVFITSLYPCLFSLSIDELQRRFRYAGTSFLATLCLIIPFIFLFINNEYAQIPSFFVFGTGRALLITVMFSYVAMEYRHDHYGRIIAFVTTVCAAIGLLQLWLQAELNGPADNDFRPFSIAFIAALTPLFYFSYWCHKHRT